MNDVLPHFALQNQAKRRSFNEMKFFAAFGGERKLGLCKKPPAFHLAACAANNNFESTSFYLILLRKMR